MKDCWSVFCQASVQSFPVVILCIEIMLVFQNIIQPNKNNGGLWWCWRRGDVTDGIWYKCNTKKVRDITGTGPLKCFCAPRHQISAKSAPKKCIIATKLNLRQNCVNQVRTLLMWTMKNYKALYILKGIVICLTRDKSGYRHQSHVPHQPDACPPSWWPWR